MSWKRNMPPYGLARQRYKYQKLRTEPMSQNEFQHPVRGMAGRARQSTGC